MASDEKRRRVAWILVLVVDVSYIAWGAMAALAPAHLLGPGSKPILAAEYEGFTHQAWAALPTTAPLAREFMTIVFRVYGAYNVAFALLATAITLTGFRRGERWAWWALLVGYTVALGSAMRYDWVLNAIGPFEMTEYLGLALVYTALALNHPFGTSAHRVSVLEASTT